jgi:hypothetical protein
MGRLALPHRGHTQTLPPAELLEPWIERTPNHWFWLGDFYDNNVDRCARFRWAAPAEEAATFMVPRLLWHYANPTEPTQRLMLENTCGLFTCINPAHWSKRRGGVRIPARIVLPESVEATPVMHESAALVVHVRWNDAISTICGHGLRRAYQNMPKTRAITCDDCIGTWIRANQPFTEVK